MPHGSVTTRSFSGGAIRGDGFIPHSQAGKNMRRHMERVRHPWRDIIIRLGCSQAAVCELRVIVSVNQVMNDSRMIRVLFPELFQDTRCFQLLRQSCVVRRGVTSRQYREGVEGLYFKVVRILVAQLAHGIFVSDYAIAWSDRSVT